MDGNNWDRIGLVWRFLIFKLQTCSCFWPPSLWVTVGGISVLLRCLLLQYGTTRDTITPLCEFLTARSKNSNSRTKTHCVNLLDRRHFTLSRVPTSTSHKDPTYGKQLLWESWHKGIYDLTNTPGSSQLGQGAWEVTWPAWFCFTFTQYRTMVGAPNQNVLGSRLSFVSKPSNLCNLQTTKPL